MPGPLDGLKIVDICRDLAGSYACMLLGDMGAQVIKVEPVDGDPFRSDASFHLWNRGRLSLAADIQTVEGHDVLGRLVTRCDVLVETYLSREARALAIEYDTLALVNPRLIYCAIPPFGESGPLADLPSDDGVVNAYAGVYGDQGGEGNPPIFVHLPIASYGTAILAAFAVSIALYAREMSGQGQKIEVPWYAGAVAMQSGSVVTGPDITYYWARGVRSQLGINPVYRLYECQDGWLFLACGNTVFWNKLCIAMGTERLLEDPRFEDAPWNIPMEHRESLSSLLGNAFREKPVAYWLKHLTQHDIPCTAVETREQFALHPQVKHNGILVETDNPLLGRIVQMGLPVNLHETPGGVGGPAPMPGQHTGEIMAWLGYSSHQVDDLSRQGVIKLG